MTINCFNLVCLGLSVLEVVLGGCYSGNPCKNGGTCTVTGRCQCPRGTYGNNCQRAYYVQKFTNVSGTITSPRFSSNFSYGTVLNYDYRIWVNASRRIKLSWITFDVNGIMPYCSGDYVEIYIGCGSKSIGRYCSGNNYADKPFDVYSPDNCLSIKFNSESFTGKGFRANYSTISLAEDTSDLSDTCSSLNTLTANSGVISSPRWPIGYPSPIDCYWKIEVGSKTNILLAFMDINLADKDIGSEDDRIMLRGGDDQESFAQSGSMGTQYGTNRPFYRLIKTDERVWIRFKADGGNSNHRGFVAGYVLYYSACYSDPCKNGGTCTVTGHFSYSCQCPTRIYGDNCQNVSTCTPRTQTRVTGTCCVLPFEYYGKSYDNCVRNLFWGTYYWCSLDAVYKGNWVRCVNPCTSRPCTRPGMICKITGFDSYTCVNYNCIGSNPCQNGGTCSQVGDDDYSCRCTKRYDGKSCQHAISSGGVSSTWVGILIGIAVLLALTCIVCISCRRRKRTRQTQQQVSASVHVPSLQVTLNHPSLPPPSGCAAPRQPAYVPPSQTRQQAVAHVHVPPLQVTLNHPRLPRQSECETPRQPAYAPPSQTGYGVPPPPYTFELPPSYSQVLEETARQEHSGGASSFPSPLTEDVTPYPSAPPGYDAPLPLAPPGDDPPYTSAPPIDDSPYPSAPSGDNSPYPSAAPPADNSPSPSEPSGSDPPYPSAPPGSTPSYPPKSAGGPSPK